MQHVSSENDRENNMEHLEINSPDNRRGRWIQTTLYELVDTIGTVTGDDREELIEGIMLNLRINRQLRTTRQWIRIQWVSQKESDSLVSVPSM
ncbi:MAG: hypothetical protein JXR76_07525 [Deltaproteobacteria bacterium]|nr:hypothetical protein [Deltaproteobacteria bacterium]